MRLAFVETPVFTRRITQMGFEADLRLLQLILLENPGVGPVDAGTGGLRKVRLGSVAHRARKRGGARVHYLWLPAHAIVYLLFVSGKGEQASLSVKQKRQLADVVGRIKAEWDAR